MNLRATVILLALAPFVFAACSNAGSSNGDNAASGNKTAIAGNAGNNAPLSEKNKRIALKNEVTRAIEAAQMLEKQGRQMESYRLATDASSKNACKSVGEDLQRQVQDLDAKVKNFPDTFGTSLAPFVNDLNACVSCPSRGGAALASCVKARASINEAIKKIYAAP